MSDALNDLYQEVVLEHKRAPRNFGHLAQPTHQAQGTNPSCGDRIAVELQLDGERVADIRFTGHACAICMASTSMMTEAVKGRDIEAAKALQQHFRAVLTGEEEPEGAPLGKLISLAGVRQYPSRIKCALLGWHALMHAIAQQAEGAGTAAVQAAQGDGATLQSSPREAP